MAKEENGKWITVKGTHVFIPDGTRPSEVLKSKFNLQTKKKTKKAYDDATEKYGKELRKEDRNIIKKYGTSKGHKEEFKKAHDKYLENINPTKEAYERNIMNQKAKGQLPKGYYEQTGDDYDMKADYNGEYEDLRQKTGQVESMARNTDGTLSGKTATAKLDTLEKGMPVTVQLKSDLPPKTALYGGKDEDGRYVFYDGEGISGAFEFSKGYIEGNGSDMKFDFENNDAIRVGELTREVQGNQPKQFGSNWKTDRSIDWANDEEYNKLDDWLEQNKMYEDQIYARQRHMRAKNSDTLLGKKDSAKENNETRIIDMNQRNQLHGPDSPEVKAINEKVDKEFGTVEKQEQYNADKQWTNQVHENERKNPNLNKTLESETSSQDEKIKAFAEKYGITEEQARRISEDFAKTNEIEEQTKQVGNFIGNTYNQDKANNNIGNRMKAIEDQQRYDRLYNKYQEQGMDEKEIKDILGERPKTGLENEDFERFVNEGYNKFHGKTDKEISDEVDKLKAKKMPKKTKEKINEMNRMLENESSWSKNFRENKAKTVDEKQKNLSTALKNAKLRKKINAQMKKNSKHVKKASEMTQQEYNKALKEKADKLSNASFEDKEKYRKELQDFQFERLLANQRETLRKKINAQASKKKAK